MTNHPYTTAGQPGTLKAAHTFIMLGAATAFVQGIVLGVHLRNIANRQMAEQSVFDPSSTVSPGSFIAVGVIGGIIAFSVWAWMAWGNGTGRPWARIVASVFYGVCTVTAIAGAVSSGPGVFKVTGTLLWVIGTIAMVLMWHPASSAFYRRFQTVNVGPARHCARCSLGRLGPASAAARRRLLIPCHWGDLPRDGGPPPPLRSDREHGGGGGR